MRTQGQWRVGDAGHTIFGPPNGQPSPETIATVRGRNFRENAQFIAKACNNYDNLLQAARNTVTYYAATQPGRRCLNDELNPCGGIRHWGMGDGCPLCSAREAITKAEGRSC
jgi:hypothetical protein